VGLTSSLVYKTDLVARTQSSNMTDNEDLEALWKDAFAAYEKETDRKLSHDAVLRRLRSTDDLLEQIESEGRAFQDWRNKHRKLWSSLSAFLAPVGAISGIALGAVSNFPPAAAVLGSVLYLVKVRLPQLQCCSADLISFSRASKSSVLMTGSSKSSQSCKNFQIG
jgi:hypothetical protein